jgi:DNA-binding winged helix-turn-helix (wHTH) protein/Tol biopolymer transport system component
MGVNEIKDQADYRLGEWTVRPTFNALFRNGTVERLEPQVMTVLNYLADNPGRVVSRDELIDQCWGGLAVTDDAVTRCISRLRNVFRQSGDDPAIETIPKRGYCLRNGEAKSELRIEPHSPPQPPPPVGPQAAVRAPRPRRQLWAAAGILLALAGAGAAIFWPDPARSGYTSDPRPLTAEPGPELWPALSPDGAYIAYSVANKERTRSAIFVRRVDGSSPPRRVAGEAYRHRSIAWSPSGSRLAFVQVAPAQPCRVMIVAANGGAEREVGRCRSSEIGWTDWISEDELVLADGPAKGWGMSLFALSIADGKRRQLTAGDGEGMGDRAPHGGGAGGKIAFLRSASLYDTDIALVDPRTSKVTMAATGFHGVYGLDWEPGGRSLLVSGSRGGEDRVWRVAPGKEPAVVPSNVTRLSRLSVGPEGNVAFERETEVQNLAQVSLEPGGETLLLDPSTSMDMDAAYSPDGQTVAILTDRTGKPEIWLLEAGRRRRLTQLEGDDLIMFGWDSAGEQILFSTRKGPELELRSVRVADGMVRTLLRNGSSGMSAAWGQQAQSVYFSSSRGGQERIWSMDVTTRRMRPITGPNRHLVRSSPDGRWIYVGDGRSPRLWRLPAGGGREQPILDVPTMDPWVWIPTDRGLFYLERGATQQMMLKRRDLATAEDRVIPTPDISAWMALAVRDDEKAVVVAHSRISEVDLQMIRPTQG